MRTTFQRLLGPFFSRRFLLFATVGASGVVVNLVCLAALEWLGVHLNVASALAIEISLLSNFFINQAWTFRDRRDASGKLFTQAVRFHLVCLVGAVVQFVTFVAMNMVWLYLVFGADAAAAYHGHTQGALERWVVHPLVEPPQVGSWIYLSQLLGIAGGTAWNYLLNFYWTWGERQATDEAIIIPAAPLTSRAQAMDQGPARISGVAQEETS